jgi:hypothetical protein
MRCRRLCICGGINYGGGGFHAAFPCGVSFHGPKRKSPRISPGAIPNYFAFRAMRRPISLLTFAKWLSISRRRFFEGLKNGESIDSQTLRWYSKSNSLTPLNDCLDIFHSLRSD